MNVSSEIKTTESPLRSTSTRIHQARKGLLLFLLITFLLSGIIEAWVILTKNENLIYLLMLMPALSSIVTRLVLREGFADVSFRLGGWSGIRAILVGLILPTCIGIVSYGIAWTTGLAQFSMPQQTGSPIVAFAQALILTTLLGTLINIPVVGGEEIGWRGYMLTRLVDAKLPRPVLLSGIIWGSWHIPLIISGIYAAGPSPLLSVVTFMLSVIAVGYIIARMRLETGSIWPAIILHGSWNAVIQSVFDPVTKGASATLWTGESGILIVVTLVIAALVASRGKWQMIRTLPKRGEQVVREEVPAP